MHPHLKIEGEGSGERILMQWNGAKDDLQVGIRDAKRPEAHSATRRQYCINANLCYKRTFWFQIHDCLRNHSE